VSGQHRVVVGIACSEQTSKARNSCKSNGDATFSHLRDDETLPVIISNALTSEQEDKLIRMLRKHSEALGWTLADKST